MSLYHVVDYYLKLGKLVRESLHQGRKTIHENVDLFIGNAGDYFVLLKKIIEDTFHQNGDKKVMLISHSMGTPYALYFLHRQTQEWKDTFIEAWMTISGQIFYSIYNMAGWLET